ncbi:Phosphatidate cytidylyltransferase [Anatilimnocola aggregata]|uniref:Phosphatidate cytidylyltransferase n=1 Tax=Anatilimnocola aggregata TaxID=2528021 RepID=A0A517YCA3_9BACT|nr:phosphatidate cytidylyltransferase [Anatilimnocola aggregata]QDU27870.1 Phosphatidate cytidylyltransferase [Anatilimnocola aggregata]
MSPASSFITDSFALAGQLTWLPEIRANIPQIKLDARTNILLGTVLVLLFAAYIVGRVLKRQPESTANPAVVRTFNLRVRAWWMMFSILIAGFVMGYSVTLVLFGVISFWALREFITMTPTRRGDHRALFWTFFLFTPLQYLLVGLGKEFYAIYTVMIPVYASLIIPARIAFSGDPKRFLERTAKIQAGLLICVYSLSHAPAILSLDLTDSSKNPWDLSAAATNNAGTLADEMPPTEPAISAAPPLPVVKVAKEPGSNAGLLFYFILLVQLNDVFQYGWGILLGKHVIAPQINASRTWEGLIGGCLCTMLVGTLLFWATPFEVWEAACISLIVAIMGSAGGITMSAIKRDRGVRDYGTLVQGHAGVLDRIDSLCFAAPVFFHITRFFFTQWS